MINFLEVIAFLLQLLFHINFVLYYQFDFNGLLNSLRSCTFLQALLLWTWKSFSPCSCVFLLAKPMYLCIIWLWYYLMIWFCCYILTSPLLSWRKYIKDNILIHRYCKWSPRMHCFCDVYLFWLAMLSTIIQVDAGR
mgnify:CR=1 FL=1